MLIALFLLAASMGAIAGDADDICAAAMKGDISRVRSLISSDPGLINARDRYSNMPLFTALIHRQYAVAAYLIDSGADLQARDIHGKSALHITAEYGTIDLMDMILRKCKDINQKADQGRTVLHEAIIQVRVDMVELLMSKKADLNAKEIHGETPLHFAVRWGPSRNAALHIDEYCSKKLEIARLLLDKKAKVNEKNLHGKTPLTLVMEETLSDKSFKTEMMELLKANGATE